MFKCSGCPSSGMIMSDYYYAFHTFQNLLIVYFLKVDNLLPANMQL